MAEFAGKGFFLPNGFFSFDAYFKNHPLKTVPMKKKKSVYPKNYYYDLAKETKPINRKKK